MSVVPVTNPHHCYSLARAIKAFQAAHYFSMDATLTRVQDCFAQVRHWRELQDGLLDQNAMSRLKERYFWWISNLTVVVVIGAAVLTSSPETAFKIGSTAFGLAQNANVAYQQSLYQPTLARQTELAGHTTCSLDEGREAEAKSGLSAQLFEKMTKTFSRCIAAAT